MDTAEILILVMIGIILVLIAGVGLGFFMVWLSRRKRHKKKIVHKPVKEAESDSEEENKEEPFSFKSWHKRNYHWILGIILYGLFFTDAGNGFFEAPIVNLFALIILYLIIMSVSFLFCWIRNIIRSNPKKKERKDWGFWKVYLVWASAFLIIYGTSGRKASSSLEDFGALLGAVFFWPFVIALIYLIYKWFRKHFEIV